MKRKRNASYKLLIFACWILGILLGLMLIATLGFRLLTSRIHYVQPGDTPTLTQEELDAFLSTELSYGAEPPARDAAAPVFLAHRTQTDSPGSDIINILLIGQDRREGETRARSDSMILCTFHKEACTLTMTSFLRDLYVAIPGYRNNRINAAYAAGGMPLLRQTILENFGVSIDGCVEVDFSGFSHLIDLMGGVLLELRQDEADWLNAQGLGSHVHSGTALLNGAQALAFARIRNLDADGDFSRTNRQRKILAALLDRCKAAPLPDTWKLLSSAMPMLTTDMREAGIYSLATELLPMLPRLKIISQRIPVEGSYSHQIIQGMAVLVVDTAANRKFLEESLKGN